MIDHTGAAKGELTRGEHKSIQTDRVVLIPGPEDEVEIVRWMYRAFVEDGMAEAEIAARLNGRGITTDLDRPWTRGAVHQVLINEKYIGNNVWNRMSFKLKKRRIRNRPDLWVRADGVFEPIVDHDLYEATQVIIRQRSLRYSDEEMLDGLRRLLQERGYLSGLIIDEAEHFPSSSAYRSRFGSLLRAYQFVGYSPGRDYRYIETNRALRRMYPDILAEVIANIERLSGSVECDPATDLLTVNGEFTASIVIVRCLTMANGMLCWKVRFDTGLRPDITVAIRMDAENQHPHDYYLLPRIDVAAGAVRLKEDNGIYWDAYRFETIDHFIWLASRVSIRSAA